MKFKTINPATEEVLNEYQTMSKAEILKIAESVHHAYSSWKKLPIAERANHLRKIAVELRTNLSIYAEQLTKEMGKPIKESIAEIEKCAGMINAIAEKGSEWLKDEAVKADGKEHIITFEPLGTILIISPWNFPYWQAFKVPIP